MPSTTGIVGKKIGMTRVYNQHGQSIPVTVIETGPCVVLQKKTTDKEGYNAIQVGFGAKSLSRLNKAEQGHVKEAGESGFYHICEFRVDDLAAYEVGQKISVADVLEIGGKVDISGTTKGRGFQGVIKRHGFAGGRATHGSMFHRAPGSIGCSAYPGRVVKGKKMPGRMGNNLVSIKNLTVVDIREEDNLVLLKGAVPGPKNNVLRLQPKK